MNKQQARALRAENSARSAAIFKSVTGHRFDDGLPQSERIAKKSLPVKLLGGQPRRLMRNWRRPMRGGSCSGK